MSSYRIFEMRHFRSPNDWRSNRFPFASGLHGNTPIFSSVQSGSISLSSSRYKRFKCFCIDMNRVHPLFYAICNALRNCHAYMEEAPIYLAFPVLTTSCNAFIHNGLSGKPDTIWTFMHAEIYPSFTYSILISPHSLKYGKTKHVMKSTPIP